MRLCSISQIRKLDQLATDSYGIVGRVLMEAAGRGAVDVLADLVSLDGTPIVVLCGTGNNGGDGFVVARHLMRRGALVRTYLCGDAKSLRGDAAANFEILRRVGADLHFLEDDQLPEEVDLNSAEFIVDALLGTGLQRPIEGRLKTLIEAVNSASRPVLALDVPSGLHADTGAVLGACINADHTTTFGYAKVGLVGDPGYRQVGTLHVVDIGIPPCAEDPELFCGETLESQRLATLLRPRAPHGHKGSFGHLLLLAGSPGKSGAALLCGRAALRTGVGLCTLATVAETARALEGRCPELMIETLCEGEPPSEEALMQRFAALVRGKTAVALGPGLARSDAVGAFVRRVVAECESPVVVDADGLNDLAQDVNLLGQAPGPRLLTPHPGEMARLTGLAAWQLQADRFRAATTFAQVHRAYVALKGARTVVAEPEGKGYICLAGNSGMATAGAGDVLTGIIGSLAAQGYASLEAICLGVQLHAEAGDRAAGRLGQHALVAGDLVEELPAVLRDFE